MYCHGIEHSVKWGIGIIGSHQQLAPPSRNMVFGVVGKAHQNDDIENSILLIHVPNIPRVESID